MKNPNSMDTLCAALCQVMGLDAPAQAAAPCGALTAYKAEKIGDQPVDRIFMYNPDAVAQWVYEKYPQLMKEAIDRTELAVPFCTVMPSVTPVCFGTMYTGAQPEVHGIQAYVKPVITIDTIFDVLLRAGKKPAIVCTAGDSLAKIYLERDMDYFFYPTVEEVNAKAAQLIMEDKHDFIVVYNGNYDTIMHKYGTEAIESLGELRDNSHAFGTFDALIQNHWKGHNTLIGFCMDHGCHDIDAGCGSHGLDMDEDLNIVHLFKLHAKEN